MIRTCSYLRDRRRAFAAGLVLAAMAAVPMPMWGQWNGTNPVWTNSNVGIGTTSPNAPLHITQSIAGSSTTNLLVLQNLNAADHATARIAYQGYTGATGTALSSIDFIGNSASNWQTAMAFNVYTGGGLLEAMRLTFNGNVGIGTTNPQYKLAVNGNIGAQDIIVTNTGWSDYVFRPGYRLRPLSEVSQYIQKNGHLPDIPTEAEVKEKGVSLGDMQAKLLAKVEELTLHMIQQDKENRELRDQMGQQTKENQKLRERLARLEKGTTTDSTPAVAK